MADISSLRLSSELRELRLQFHWASQVLSSFSDLHLERRDDDSHSNLGFDAENGRLSTRCLPDGRALALDLLDAALSLVGADGIVTDRFELNGSSLEEAQEWAGKLIPSQERLALRDYEMPEHPVAAGSRFALADREERASLSAWCGLADRELRSATSDFGRESEVRLWPHHFDFGALLLLSDDADPETDPSIGIGMSLGDETFPLPYFYVNPYGVGKPSALPDLPPGGSWASSWFGAVLLAEHVVEGGPSLVGGFLSGAIRICEGFVIA